MTSTIVFLLVLFSLPGLVSAQTWPCKPSGSTVITSYPFNVLPPGNQSNPIDGWHLFSGRASIVQDSGDPFSPPNVLKYNYEVGFPGGIGPGNFYHALNHNRVYVGQTWKPSSPWQNHPSNINKIGFLVGPTGTNALIPIMYGTNQLRIHIATVGQNNTGVNGGGFAPPQDNGEIVLWHIPGVTLGAWHRLEMIAEIFTPGQPTGVLKVCLNGVQVVHATNIRWANGPWTQYEVNSTWGGTGETKTQNDAFYYGHVELADVTGGGPPLDNPPGPPGTVTGVTVTVQ